MTDYFRKMEDGREIWKRDNLMIASVQIISDVLATTSPLTRDGVIKAIQDECAEEPKTLAMVLSMLTSIWHGIKFEEDGRNHAA